MADAQTGRESSSMNLRKEGGQMSTVHKAWKQISELTSKFAVSTQEKRSLATNTWAGWRASGDTDVNKNSKDGRVLPVNNLICEHD